jgi:hypothetical protein
VFILEDWYCIQFPSGFDYQPAFEIFIMLSQDQAMWYVYRGLFIPGQVHASLGGMKAVSSFICCVQEIWLGCHINH